MLGHSNNINRSNQVTIYIRPPLLSSHPRSSFTLSCWGPGHASLETFFGGKNSIKGRDNEGHYISFWPGDCGYQKCSNQDKNQSHFHTREEDDDYYGEPVKSEDKFTLYFLDIEKINTEFEKRRSSLAWSAGGGVSGDRSYANCSSLIFDLLLEGGLNNILNIRMARLNSGIENWNLAGQIASLINSMVINPILVIAYRAVQPLIRQNIHFRATVLAIKTMIQDLPDLHMFDSVGLAILTARERAGQKIIATTVHPFWEGLGNIEKKIGSYALYLLILFSSMLAAYFAAVGFGSLRSSATIFPADLKNILKKAQNLEVRERQENESRLAPENHANSSIALYSTKNSRMIFFQSVKNYGFRLVQTASSYLTNSV